MPPHASGGSAVAQPVRDTGSFQFELHAGCQKAYSHRHDQVAGSGPGNRAQSAGGRAGRHCPDRAAACRRGSGISRRSLEGRESGDCCIERGRSARRIRDRGSGPGDLGQTRPVKIRYTLPALADLDSILTYISASSPKGAARVQKRIQDVVGLLLTNPEIGLRTDDPDPEVDQRPTRFSSSTRLGTKKSSSMRSAMAPAIPTGCQVNVIPLK